MRAEMRRLFCAMPFYSLLKTEYFYQDRL
eukprot:COSAG05_NODE_10954_length_537_cov_1.488584_1_plen_28_part_10